MAETPFILQEHQYKRIKNILERLSVECVARVVFLVDRDGQPIAFHGEIAGMDTTSFSSLAAGNVAATTSMASSSVRRFSRLSFTRVNARAFYISVIGRSLLVVVFDEKSTVRLVRISAQSVPATRSPGSLRRSLLNQQP